MKKILFALLCSLILAGSTNADTYVVKSGDTLYKIGKSFGVSYETIAEDNGITNPNLILVGQRLQVEKKLGYTPVTDYSSRTTQYISATATTIPVASTKDSAGNQIVLSNISTSGTVKVYLNIEPGGTNVEPVICTGLTTTSWTNCSRGIAFQGSSEVASSSLAKPHNAGSKIIITNIGQFYNQYVSVDGNQQVNDLKTFSSGQIGFTGTRKIIDNGTNLGWTDNGVDTYTFAAGGSGLTASTTKAIGITDSKIYVNASSTTGMSFDANGALYQKINSSSGVEYASGSAGIGINTSTLVSLIATSTPTAGKMVMTSSTSHIDLGWIPTSTLGYTLITSSTGAIWDSPVHTFISSSTFSCSTAYPSSQSTTASTTVPTGARYAILNNVNGHGTSNGGYGGGQIYYAGNIIDASIKTLYLADTYGTNSADKFTSTVTWDNNQVRVYFTMGTPPSNNGGASGSGVINFYK